MSFDPLTPSLDSAALPMFQFDLEAHTESANALAEQLFYGQISQTDYDARIYSATIVSTDRAVPKPIIMTLDDTLAALLAYANRKFGMPLATAHLTKMYVLSSAEIIHAVGAHTSPGVMMLLEQDNLKMVLTCMKQGSQMEQLFVEFAESDTTPLEGIWAY